MPLARSTIVFAIATCIPFGLAIRDTVAGKPFGHAAVVADEAEARAEREAALSAEREYEYTRNEAALAEANRVRALHRMQAVQPISELYGARPGTLGKLFDGVTLDGPPSRLDPIADQIAALRVRPGIVIQPTDDPKMIDTLFISVDQDLCSVLDRQLVAAWGAGYEYRDDRIWLTDDGMQRAVFHDRTGCSLEFQRAAPVKTWLNRTADSLVPLWAIGQPVNKLVATLHDPEVLDSEVIWFTRGVGSGSGGVRITAQIWDGKVLNLQVQVTLDPKTQELLTQQITSLVGTWPIDGLVWNTKPRVELQPNISDFLLVIGNRRRD